ncbi:MAG: TetR/AcrR family transcriptional regulator [Aquificae bacterium]|nr:TetR/AcrR family transcriptional regulator [Aquificota bacterium]
MGKKRKKVSERKEEVFLIISQIIAEKGLSEVSTVEVARRLGVSQPAIYKYFKNKDEMIIYFLEHLKSQLEAVLKKAKEGKTTKDKLHLLYQEHLKLIQKTKILPRVIFSDVVYLGDPKKKQALREAILTYKRGIVDIVKEGIKKGELKEVDPEIFSRFFIGSVISTTLMWMLNDMEADLVSEADRLINNLDVYFQ